MPSGPSMAAGSRSGIRVIESFADRRFLPLSGLVAIWAACLCAITGSRSGFFLDDFWMLGEARDLGLSPGYLTRPITHDHLHPGRRLIEWLLVTLGPEWWMAVAFLTACTFVTVILTSFTVRRISGSATISLLAAAALGGSAIMLRSDLWWSSGVQELPAMALSLIAILTALRWDGSRSRVDLIASPIALLAATMFFDKYAAVLAIAIVLLVFARPPGQRLDWHSLTARTRSCLPLLGALAAAAILCLLGYVFAVERVSQSLTGATRHAGAREWLSYLAHWWSHGVGATVLNSNTAIGPNIVQDPNPAPDRLAWLGVVLLLALAATTIRGWRSAAIWVSAGLIITASAVGVGSGRLATFGAAYLLDPRYQDLTLLTLVLLVPAAWRASGGPHPRTTASLTATAAFTIGFAVLWFVNGRQALREWGRQPQAAAAWSANYSQSLERVARGNGGSPITILSAAAPPSVVGPQAVSRYTTTGPLASLLAPGVATVTAISASGARSPVVTFDRFGRAQPADSPAVLRLGTGPPACGASPPATSWRDGRGFNVTAAIPLPLRGTSTGPVLAVRMSRLNGRGSLTLTASGSRLPFAVLPTASYPDGVRVEAPAAIRSVSVGLTGGASGCITAIEATPPLTD